MKNITLIHFAYPPNPGGVERVIEEQAHLLKDLGFKVKVLTGSGNDNKVEVKEIKNLQSVGNFNPELQKKMLGENIFDEEFKVLSKEIGQELDKELEDQDVIIVHNMLSIYRNLPFIEAFSTYSALHPEKKFINWIHDHMLIDKDRIKEERPDQFMKDLITKPLKNTIYVAISSTFAKLLRDVIKGVEIKIIPDGVDIRDELEIGEGIWGLIQKHNLLDASPLFLIPANIVERKNIEYSINVLKEVRNKFSKTKLLISGDVSKHKDTMEYYKKLKDLIKELGIENEAIFLREEFENPRSEKDLNDLYKICDAVLYFSKSENFGLPILEAALQKIPIFLSDLRVFREIGGDNLEYMDVKKQSPKETAQRIIELLQNDKEFLMRKNVKSNYNMETILKKNLVPLIRG